MATFTDLVLTVTRTRDYIEFQVDTSLVVRTLDFSTLRANVESTQTGNVIPAGYRVGYLVNPTTIRVYKYDLQYNNPTDGYFFGSFFLQVSARDTLGDLHLSNLVSQPILDSPPGFSRGVGRSNKYHIKLTGTPNTNQNRHPTFFATVGQVSASGIIAFYFFCTPFVFVFDGRATATWGFMGRNSATWEWRLFISTNFLMFSKSLAQLGVTFDQLFGSGALVFSDPNIAYTDIAKAADGGAVAVAMVKTSSGVNLIFKRSSNLTDWPTDENAVPVGTSTFLDVPTIFFENPNGSGAIYICFAHGQYRSTQGGKAGSWQVF